ncbi:MAG: GNAT family N-acetyltransferase, partial [Lentisphaeria bacterium]|nr:GNAT family N-acetyltransferase [Lentisphaeria bacterium]
MRISKISISDLEAVVEVHMASFPSFFLTTLGKSFLRQYYKAVAAMPDGIVLGAYSAEGELMGFCAATTHCNGFNKRLLIRHCIPMGWQAFCLLCT